MQTYEQTFTSVNTWKLNVPGSYFVTLDCTKTLNVRLYKSGKKLDLGDINGLLAGLEIGPLANLGEPAAFDLVEIDVQAGDTVKVGIGNGGARYNRANASVTVTNNKVAQSGVFTSAPLSITTASTAQYAASSTRQYLLIQNNDPTATVYLNFGASAVTVTNGIRLLPGQSFEQCGIVSTQQINMIASAATSAVVGVVG